jgi:hypothetical protein
MENFKEIYKEIATNLSEIEGVEWVDLWNSQVYNLEGEHPFPAPAVFLAFRSQLMENAGVKMQKVRMQMDVFLFFETFADTYHGSWNQERALQFLDTIDAINFKLHGSNGNTYTGMTRISFSPVDTGGAGNLFNITYECTVMDYSATKPLEDGTFADMNIVPASSSGYILD